MGQKERTTRQSLRRIMTMTAVLVLAVVASGCTVANGGGWLRSVSDPLGITGERATFGINGKCGQGQFVIDHEVFRGAGLFDGQFEYDDHAVTINRVGVQFHGRVTASDTNP